MISQLESPTDRVAWRALETNERQRAAATSRLARGGGARRAAFIGSGYTSTTAGVEDVAIADCCGLGARWRDLPARLVEDCVIWRTFIDVDGASTSRRRRSARACSCDTRDSFTPISRPICFIV